MESPSPNLVSGRGLPANLDAERFVLGAILIDDRNYVHAAGLLTPEDFSLDRHQRIFARMGDLYAQQEKIDRVTLANELMKHGELEACGNLSYLVSLDDGLPPLINLDSYIRIVRDKAMLRRMIFTAQKIMDRCFLSEESSDEILASAEESLLRLGDLRTRAGLLRPEEIIEQHGGLDSFLRPETRIRGISTGFVKFDQMTGGLHGGELIIIAARPAMGKTALALNIAHHAARQKNPVAIFSLEMSCESLLNRILCAAARVDGAKFRAGFLDANERRRLQIAAADLTELPLFIDDTAGINLLDIHSKLRRVQAEHGLGLVIIDYLQLMTARGRYENRVQEVSALSRGLKLMAKELNVPIIALSQLSRAPETRKDNHRPQLSDLRESGSIEQDADLVAFIFREEVYSPQRKDLRGKAELLVAKQRNGPTGAVKLAYLHAFTKFENYTSDLPDDEEHPEQD